MDNADIKGRLIFIADTAHATADAARYPHRFGGHPTGLGQDLEGLADRVQDLVPYLPADLREEAESIREALWRAGSFAQDYKGLIRAGASWPNGVKASASRLYRLVEQIGR